MLRIDLAEVRSGAVETPGRFQPSDPFLTGAGIALAGPLRIEGRFSRAGEGKYFWHARMETSLRLECRRCLTAVEVPLSQPLDLLFIAEPDDAEDDVGCYAIPARAREIDLRDAVREELLLAVPQFVECRPDCRGLCTDCGANLNAGPCGCRPKRDPRWEALSDLLPGRPTED
jgi:DUF177 domain-containing protein